MKELKTIKDLGNDTRFCSKLPMFARSELKKEIKAEAVKRAKLYTIKANTKGLKDYEIKYWTARRIEVMEFNNLTEEDLK